ncbi:MAG: helix-turn-helix domain-containing protein [Alicyclobacillaceae bacterium]|nr:helix-turn-helix domain-containing protein [Alicyclobacillaceae bacterium]
MTSAKAHAKLMALRAKTLHAKESSGAWLADEKKTIEVRFEVEEALWEVFQESTTATGQSPHMMLQELVASYVQKGQNTEYMTVEVAADQWGYNPSHIKRLCRAGKVEAHKHGKVWLIATNQPNPRKVEKS